jgi:hypothetical protein
MRRAERLTLIIKDLKGSAECRLWGCKHAVDAEARLGSRGGGVFCLPHPWCFAFKDSEVFENTGDMISAGPKHAQAYQNKRIDAESAS